MIRYLKKLYLIVVIILGTSSSVYADPIVEQKVVNLTNIEIKAKVPEGFTKDILINFTLNNGTNALYTLTSSENYVCNGYIEVGKAQLNFINIVNGDNEYIYSASGSITAQQGSKAKFNIVINKNGVKKLDSNSTTNNINIKNIDKDKNIVGNHTQEELEASNKDNIDTKNNKKESDKAKNQEIKNDNLDKQANNFFKKYFLTLIVMMICGIVYLTIKVKNREKS